MQHPLLDTLQRELHVKNDTALAPLLGTDRSAISGIRAGKRRITASMILAIFQTTGMPIARIQALIQEGGQS